MYAGNKFSPHFLILTKRQVFMVKISTILPERYNTQNPCYTSKKSLGEVHNCSISVLSFVNKLKKIQGCLTGSNLEKV